MNCTGSPDRSGAKEKSTGRQRNELQVGIAHKRLFTRHASRESGVHECSLREDSGDFPQPKAAGMTNRRDQAVGFSPYQRGVYTQLPPL